VIVGTGVGSGVVVHGRVLDGPTALRANGDTIRFRGRATTSAPATRAIAVAAAASRRGCPAGDRARSCEATGERRDAKGHCRRCGCRDAEVRAHARRYEERFARAIAHVINLLDPDVIVLGGGMSNVDRLYTNVPKHWAPGCSRTASTRELVRNVPRRLERRARGRVALGTPAV
jgi:predicted NBD/HSP70 family sugar kinase